MDSWFEVALAATIFAVGNILFGHFEERTPKWRRVAAAAPGHQRLDRRAEGALLYKFRGWTFPPSGP